ncbi:hypothetical protein SLEP1_g9469 [Rubroshorea leprosula]|uniref:Uncharacterized protein n=1 Tax=Rubroshorea leprosula TaxID=152421 RepID=A0AAV5I9I2_9ROSI|nr:hypothetical protein SLEP1_g9469 [Rubroshorea leprosula]
MDKEQTVLLEMHDEERKQRQESEEKLRARLRVRIFIYNASIHDVLSFFFCSE